MPSKRREAFGRKSKALGRTNWGYRKSLSSAAVAVREPSMVPIMIPATHLTRRVFMERMSDFISPRSCCISARLLELTPSVVPIFGQHHRKTYDFVVPFFIVIELSGLPRLPEFVQAHAEAPLCQILLHRAILFFSEEANLGLVLEIV